MQNEQRLLSVISEMTKRIWKSSMYFIKSFYSLPQRELVKLGLTEQLNMNKCDMCQVGLYNVAVTQGRKTFKMSNCHVAVQQYSGRISHKHNHLKSNNGSGQSFHNTF